MRYSANVIAAAALLLANGWAGTAIAQSLSLPPEAEIQTEMAKHREEAAAVLGQNIKPVKPGTFKVEVPTIKAPPPVRTQSLDDIMQQYAEAKKGGPAPAKRGANDLIIFVSFSMPKPVLTELARQAKETGAVMVVRGFKDGSLRATKLAALEVNRAGAPWEIHPDLFKAFKVTAVPTFVVASAEAESVLEDGCSPETAYSAVAGNMSVELALDTIRRRAQPTIAKLAENRLAAIRTKNQPGTLR
ncbi:type-F conjugative transfer system pilin assembly protein TrbC (plasmid) [Cupriavidus metallidurans]|uniref:type-F conjugative transfer system pilin assembly protein TrbC n=1 Tax=Cupriavidus metallidurans TaxID=119219 RepID=UPI003D70B2DC